MRCRMEENRSYSLGLYEKAIPVGMTFPQMFAIAKQCGFDRLEISVDTQALFGYNGEGGKIRR